MIWEHPETRCGPGSTLKATEGLRDWLPDALARHGVKRLLDAPCGDRNWIKTLELPCEYVGVDHEAEHVAKADGADVRLLDIRTDPLPACDAILSRDFFQHLSAADAAAALANMRATGARLLFATCHGAGENTDCITGNFRFVNMREAPFSLGPPLDRCDDGPHGRILGVWAL